MFGIGPRELIIVVFIALVVFGPRTFPQMAWAALFPILIRAAFALPFAQRGALGWRSPFPLLAVIKAQILREEIVQLESKEITHLGYALRYYNLIVVKPGAL